MTRAKYDERLGRFRCVMPSPGEFIKQCSEYPGHLPDYIWPEKFTSERIEKVRKQVRKLQGKHYALIVIDDLNE